MASQVGLPSAVLASHMVVVQVPAVPLSIKLLDNASGKAMENGLIT